MNVETGGPVIMFSRSTYSNFLEVNLMQLGGSGRVLIE